MAGIIEKIKSFFCGICKPKKKEEIKLEQEEPKPEEKPEEQK